MQMDLCKRIQRQIYNNVKVHVFLIRIQESFDLLLNAMFLKALLDKQKSFFNFF